MTVIENIALKRRVDVSLVGANIATYTAAAIFLPYILSAMILIFLSIYLLVNKQTRQMIFINKGSNLLKIFLAYIVIVPLFFRNWAGVGTGIVMIFAAVLGLYIRNIMTKDLFEKIMTLMCTFSLTSAGYAIVEKAVNYLEHGSSRVSAVFFYPNYFGTVVGIVIIICAYKVLTKQKNTWFFYMVAFMNLISVYLCKSMFVWVEVFVGVAVLLMLLKRHRLLAVWLMAAAIGGFMILFMNVNIIPRLNDVEVTVRLRQQIWHDAIGAIVKSPWIGHGFYSYMYLFDNSYLNQVIPHSHSIYIDSLLNFGIIGTSLIVLYFSKIYHTVLRICFKEKNPMITSLILAVTAASLVHGITDITLLWVQTLPLFLLILAGVGAFEKDERKMKSSNY
jgi:Lipid A core - O-antigen ligase and related enzymes